jgi:hypothetical protein
MADKKKLNITSDVYTAMDGAAYGEPYKALEDGFDNCLNGINDNRISTDEPRQIIADFYCGDSSTPDNIRITDNGIGMDEDTIENKLFVTQKVSALEKAAKGGTGRWGYGFKQLTHYLGTPGDVITREAGLDDEFGIRALATYEDGKQPMMSIDRQISKERFEQECHGFEHGTRIDINNIKKEKWTSSWWNPKGNTWFKSTQSRYNRLLRDKLIQIVFNKHTGKGIESKVLAPAEFILDNGCDDADAKIDYQNCSRNNWTIKGKEMEVEKLGLSVDVNIGKHLSAMWKDEWNTIGDVQLIAGSATKSANPTIYFYQNNVLLDTFKFKGSDRDGGLSHLNNLFTEVNVPSDVIVPTNTTKSGIDDAWKKEVAAEVKKLAETKWLPQNVNEELWHKAFEKKVLHPMDGAGIRQYMFDGVSVDDLKEDLYHEFPKGASRPDFKWENGELKAIIEFKDEKATDDAVKQMAKYVMSTEFEADYYYLVAPSFNDSVKNEFKSWNKSFGEKFGCKFKTISFDEIALKID